MFKYERKEDLLTVNNLTVAFDTPAGKNKNVVLNNISVNIKNIVRPDSNIQQGQVVALLGPSGIGKTQLFRCLAGLQKPTAGEVLLNGDKHVYAPGEVGVVAQNYILFNHRTVLKNLEVIGNVKHFDKIKFKTKIDEYLVKFGLVEHQNKYPAQLSGGQRQRLAIIQQLLCSKYFLLMDEPFSGLDVVSKKNVCDLITQVSVENELNTIIVTTHDVQTAVAMADTIWILGRTFDENKKNLGASVIKTIDLIERGLAWEPDIRHLPQYKDTVDEIESLFFTL